MMIIRIMAALLLVATSVAWAVRPAAACTCATVDPEAWLERADAALVGRVVSRSELGGPGSGMMSGYVFTFEPEIVVKGDIGDRVEVYSSPYGAQCGFEFGAPDGERVGAFLQLSSQGNYESYSCFAIDPDVLASLAPPGETAAVPSSEFPPDDVSATDDAVLASDSQDSSSESLAPAAEESGNGRDIALWSAISFSGLAALLIGYAVLRKLNLRRRSTP